MQSLLLFVLCSIAIYTESHISKYEQEVEMAQFMWDDDVSLDADILLGADLLYDPGTLCHCLKKPSHTC